MRKWWRDLDKAVFALVVICLIIVALLGFVTVQVITANSNDQAIFTDINDSRLRYTPVYGMPCVHSTSGGVTCKWEDWRGTGE